MKDIKNPKPNKSKLFEAQEEVQRIATVSEEKQLVVVAIHEAIFATECKLENLRALEKSYLESSFAVVEATRRDLEALLED